MKRRGGRYETRDAVTSLVMGAGNVAYTGAQHLANADLSPASFRRQRREAEQSETGDQNGQSAEHGERRAIRSSALYCSSNS